MDWAETPFLTSGNEERRRFFGWSKPKNGTPKFVIFFSRDWFFFEKSAHSKKASEAKSCRDSGMPQFESRQLLRKRYKNLWIKRRNPGSKKPGNGWCAWLCARRIYTGNSLWPEWNYRIPRNYEQQKWYSGSRQSVFSPILNREHLRRPIGQGAAFFFSQLRDKLSQSSAIGRRWELSLVLLALDFFF